MAELPILRFKTDAWTADTSWMSPEVKGCYIDLLVAMCRNAGHDRVLVPHVRDNESRARPDLRN